MVQNGDNIRNRRKYKGNVLGQLFKILTSKKLLQKLINKTNLRNIRKNVIIAVHEIVGMRTINRNKKWTADIENIWYKIKIF